MDVPSTKLEPGVVLDGRYRLTGHLGGGGMGQVWAAQHLTLGHHVAVKVLHGHIMSSAEPKARFEREARLMAQLGESSRHITRVIEHGVLADGTPYLVMERLRGEGLDALLKRTRALPLAELADIVSQLCRALAVAHGEGVVHRDIKPANIFLCRDEDGRLLVKLLDFGVAKALLDAGDQTVSGQVIGTPNYMSPEQLTGEATIDHRSDLFAVGSIAYRCATGQTPFGKGSISEMAMRIVSMSPRPPTSLNPSLPLSFDAFAGKALAKRPSERFSSARELSDALLAIVREAGSGAHLIAALPPPPDSGLASVAPPSLGDSVTQPPAKQPSRRGMLWIGAAGVLVLLLVGARAVLSSSAAERAPDPASSGGRAVAAPSARPSAAEIVPAPPAPVVSASAAPSASAAASSLAEPPAPPPAARTASPKGPTPARPGGPVPDTWRKRDEM
jgi:eukaryotic-like serine/threonine-protein kinase